MPVAVLEAVELLRPTSETEAVAAFGDGANVTVLAGGTIVVPELTYGRLQPQRVLLLREAGLDQISRDGSTWRIGAAVTLEALAEGPEPLATAAQRVADVEIRRQATLGGNLCAPPGRESPRGDLQAALVALGARVRSAGEGGERTEDVEAFLAAGPAGRLVLELEVEEAERASYVSLGRPHAHAYTLLSVACAARDGTVRVSVGGCGPHAVRCPAVEAALQTGTEAVVAAARAVDDTAPLDDALASAWYRSRVLPSLVARALADL